MTDQNLAPPPPLVNKVTGSVCNKLGRDATLNDYAYITLQICIIVVLSRIFHLLLKRFGQPRAVSQMLAGLLVGRTCLGHISKFKNLYKIEDDDHLISMATIGSSFFMFLLGLETDFQFLRQSLRAAAIFTACSIVTCTVIAAITGPILYGIINIHGGRVLFVFLLIIILSNSASPMLIQMMTDIEVIMSKVGRIGISTALINDVTCLAVIAVVVLFPMPNAKHMSARKILYVGIGAVVIIAVLSGVMHVIIWLINRMNLKKQVIPEEVLWTILLVVFRLSTLTDFLGFHSMTVAFILGLVFPRDGSATRSATTKLTILVNDCMLPIYFGYAGVQTDLFRLGERNVLITVSIVVMSGTLAKVVSTVVVAKYLGMKVKEGLVLGFLLNVKGHVELIVVTLGIKYGIWGKEIHQALLISMLFCSMTAGPAAAYIVHQERRAIKYHSSGLEWLDLDCELRILACVHSPHDLPTILDLIQISSGIDRTPLAPFLIHLIQFSGHVTTSLLYNQIQEDALDAPIRDVRQINAAIDTFKLETGIKLRQLSAVSRFTDMHEDLCNGAQEVCAALVIVPYHRKQRFDGRMGAGKEGIREFNINMLRHAPCTVGILVDRGLGSGGGGAVGGTASSVQVGDLQMLYQVVVVFFGGRDDREALAYGCRLAMHPCVSVTVVRFLPRLRQGGRVSRKGSRSRNKSCEVLMEVEEVGDSDEEFMMDFHTRFVATGMITYIEHTVENSAETVTTLASMQGMYALYIVGKDKRGQTAHLTVGMSAWQECQELGEIGDLLASSDFMLHGSVLILQRCDTFQENILGC